MLVSSQTFNEVPWYTTPPGHVSPTNRSPHCHNSKAPTFYPEFNYFRQLQAKLHSTPGSSSTARYKVLAKKYQNMHLLQHSVKSESIWINPNIYVSIPQYIHNSLQHGDAHKQGINHHEKPCLYGLHHDGITWLSRVVFIKFIWETLSHTSETRGQCNERLGIQSMLSLTATKRWCIA